VADKDQQRKTAPLRIGLTGGIASGKTAVANMFAEMGAAVIDTDLIARGVVWRSNHTSWWRSGSRRTAANRIFRR